jgi:predicted solute-binding protein
MTNKFGYYRFDDVPAGDTYIFNARVKGYQFSNNTQVLNISEDLQDVNFNAFPSRRDFFEPMF